MPICNKRKVTSWDPWLLRGSVSFCSLRSAVQREMPDTPTLVPVLSSLHDDCVLSELVGPVASGPELFPVGRLGRVNSMAGRVELCEGDMHRKGCVQYCKHQLTHPTGLRLTQAEEGLHRGRGPRWPGLLPMSHL